MYHDNSPMFNRYVRTKNKIIYPWSLSIVDCFLLFRAFATISSSDPVGMIRIWGGEGGEESLSISSAYSLYDVDTEAYGSEVVLIHRDSDSYCYWDLYERFVLASGSEQFISLARPYPQDIEKHRYLEDMDACGSERPEAIYEELVTMHRDS